jgi:hypothetical protein
MEFLPSGELLGSLTYNPEEFDEDRVRGWLSAYQRILSRAVEPDRAWRSL